MAIPNINNILKAQAIQRGEESSKSESSENEMMEILKLIFEYMKQNNKQVQKQLQSIYEQEEEIKNELEKLRLKNNE